MATAGRLLPGSLESLNSPGGVSFGTRGCGLGSGARVRASDRCDDPSRPLL